MRAQLTVTLPADIARYVERRSREEGISKSAVVSRALEAQRRQQEEELMREGYEEMAEHDRKFVAEWD